MFMNGKTQYFKMSVLPSLINAIPIKIPPSYFADIDNLILEFLLRAKDPEQPTQY